jgi:hypothetical protein
VHGVHHVLGESRVGDRPAPLARDTKSRAEQRLSSGRAEKHEHARLDSRELAVEPVPASGDFGAVRLVMDAPLPPGAPLEVLHRIRHVHPLSVDACGSECFVEHASRGTDERPTGEIFAISGLLTHEHQRCVRRPFAEHRLGGVAPQVARTTVGRVVSEPCDIRGGRHARSSCIVDALRGANPSQSLLK